MKILLLNHNLKEHGTYFRAFQIARGLASRGHDCRLLTQSARRFYRRTFSREGLVEIVELPNFSVGIVKDDGWGPLDVMWRMKEALCGDYDLMVAFAHPPNVFYPAAFWKRFREKPLVVDWCDWYGRGGIFQVREEIRLYRQDAKGWRLAMQRWAECNEERMEEEIVKFADAVTVISRSLEDRAADLGVRRSRLLRFPSGAPLDQVSPLDKQECRRKLGIDPGPILFGYVANYHPDEHIFLEAVGKALRAVKGARVVVVGPPFTEGLAEEYGVAEGLMAVGRRPFEEIPVWLGACDVLLLPLADNISNRGRWPNKIGDYLASGRPIVTNRVGDAPEYVERGGAGVVTDPNVEAFAEGIVATAQQKHRWPTWGREARAIAERELSWSSINGRVAEFLESMDLLHR